MIARLNKTADMIDANRRILICRVDRKIETDQLLVTNLAEWLKRISQ